MSDLPIKATLKAGTGYDAPWVTVDGADPDDLAFKLNALANGGALEAVVNAANVLKAVNNVAPIAADVASPPPVQQQAPAQPAWGNPPVQEVVPSWAAQSAQPQQQAAPLPPGSRVCELPTCNNLLEHKNTSSGKAVLRCPDWRWNSGNPNGHSSEFVN